LERHPERDGMRIETVVVGQFQVNCYVVVGDDGGALVVDPGGDAGMIATVLDRHGANPAAYLLTHAHMDHIWALNELYAARPAPVAVHPEELTWAFTDANTMPPFYTAPPERPAAIERELAEGQTWNDAGLEYQVIETPGHTPGSVSFFFPESKVLICGDTLFAGSVGRTDLPGGSPTVLQASLKKIAALSEETRVLSGHGPETTIAQEKRTNYFMQGL
jgi:glyoxylase-like metal-dependent hydrolase (beta-lactamase superfamily II)